MYVLLHISMVVVQCSKKQQQQQHTAIQFFNETDINAFLDTWMKYDPECNGVIPRFGFSLFFLLSSFFLPTQIQT